MEGDWLAFWKEPTPRGGFWLGGGGRDSHYHQLAWIIESPPCSFGLSRSTSRSAATSCGLRRPAMASRKAFNAELLSFALRGLLPASKAVAAPAALPVKEPVLFLLLTFVIIVQPHVARSSYQSLSIACIEFHDLGAINIMMVRHSIFADLNIAGTTGPHSIGKQQVLIPVAIRIKGHDPLELCK